MDSYDVIKNYLLDKTYRYVTAEDVCSRFDLRMGEVRKIFMRLNREGILSHKKHNSDRHDGWRANYYMVDQEKLNREMRDGMDEQIIKLHYRAALLTGKKSACGTKINYESEESANRAAIALNQKVNRPNFHKLEAYPCPFCNGWHIGREMPIEELNSL